MAKKVKQDADDQPQVEEAAVVTTEPVNDTPAPAPEANGQQKEKEPKDARFRRLAVRRVNKALKVIAAVGNLASRQTYAYTDDQAVRVVNTLIDAVNAVRDKFVGGSKPTGGWTL